MGAHYTRVNTVRDLLTYKYSITNCAYLRTELILYIVSFHGSPRIHLKDEFCKKNRIIEIFEFLLLLILRIFRILLRKRYDILRRLSTVY